VKVSLISFLLLWLLWSACAQMHRPTPTHKDSHLAVVQDKGGGGIESTSRRPSLPSYRGDPEQLILELPGVSRSSANRSAVISTYRRVRA